MKEPSLVALSRAEKAVWITALLANAVALWMVFAYAPVEVVMGPVQKIFYYHVPSAMTGYALVFLAFIFSCLFLWKEQGVWDVLAHSAAEVGWVFLTLVLITGPIWARVFYWTRRRHRRAGSAASDGGGTDGSGRTGRPDPTGSGGR